MVQVFTIRMLNHKRDNAEAVGVEVAKNLNIGVWRPTLNCPPYEIVFVGPNYVNANRFFELKYKPGANGFDNCWSAALFAVLHMLEVHVLGLVDVGDRATTDTLGHRIAQEFLANN